MLPMANETEKDKITIDSSICSCDFELHNISKGPDQYELN